jgi:hypothetical protein
MIRAMAKSGELIFIDSSVFMFGKLKQGKTEEEQRMARKAEALLDHFGGQGAIFGLTVISLAEILSGIKPEDQLTWMARIKENFVIAPFNEKAVLKMAPVFQEKYSGYKNKYDGVRPLLKDDLKILGSMLAFDGVSRFITTDTRFHSWANSYLKTELLPDPPPKQGDMFEQSDTAD